MLEYVSNSSERKDHGSSLETYEKRLKVPYYLTFYPEHEEWTLFHLRAKKYRAVVPNTAGRCPLPELDLELGLLGGWIRYWFRGSLLPLPAELQAQFDALQAQLTATQGQLTATQSQLATREG